MCPLQLQLGEACSHIAAVLFVLEANVQARKEEYVLHVTIYILYMKTLLKINN